MDNPSEFFGQTLSLVENEVIAIGKVDPKLLKLEAGLYETKWWDYRHLHPVTATYLFAHEYNKAYQFIVKRCRDVERGAYMKGFKGKDIFEVKQVKRKNKQTGEVEIKESEEITAFWKARQSADRLGIRYDFYIRKAMMWAEDRNWRNIPRPIHLYSDDLIEHLQECWTEERAARLQSAMAENYLLENYSAHPDQDAYREWAFDQVSHRRHKEFALHHFLQRGQVPEGAAIERFGSDTVRRALEIELE